MEESSSLAANAGMCQFAAPEIEHGEGERAMESADVKRIGKFFERDRFARHVGVELLEVGTGRAKVRLQIGEEHLNGVDLVHGAAIFALADFAFAVASNSHGTVALGINANISYLQAARGGALIAEAEEVSRNPKLATYHVKITDEAGELIALFQGTVYRKREPLRG